MINEQLKNKDVCSTTELLEAYKHNPYTQQQKHNAFRIISAILVADRRHSYDNFFAVASHNLVEFLPPLKDVLLSDDCPLNAESLTGKVPTFLKKILTILLLFYINSSLPLKRHLPITCKGFS